MVTNSFGKTATFMPKPVKGDNGSECIVTNQFGKEALPYLWGKNTQDFQKRHFIILEEF